MAQPNTVSSAPQREGDDEHAHSVSYLDPHATEQSWTRWREIQIDFLDNPRTAVAKARGLVGELIDDIVHRFEAERSQLEERWANGDNVSTEDLRRSLQRYRDFFGRLLAKLGDEGDGAKREPSPSE